MTFIRVLIFTLLLSVSANAQPYFNVGSIPQTSIDAPPAVGSAEWKQEIDQIIALQKTATDAEITKAKEERNMMPELLAAQTNPLLIRKTHPALYKLLDRVADTSYAVADYAKDYWDTKRPYLMDERVKTLVKPHDNPAYPSGHACGSYTWAYVLSMVFPRDREKFLARAEEISQHRVLVGMHFPHDLKGGKQLALLVVGGLLQNADFQKDLAAAKLEANK